MRRLGLWLVLPAFLGPGGCSLFGGQSGTDSAKAETPGGGFTGTGGGATAGGSTGAGGTAVIPPENGGGGGAAGSVGTGGSGLIDGGPDASSDAGSEQDARAAGDASAGSSP